ncbi:hypothetical protein N7474_010431 [Penicillium riverlandense]|uniref:uncharacterized protein n=1 Tax=Penicillium riverlandense TaxID=1903569 RepID=UPI002548C0DD|nr:uncharacterized protein N7474_010431 [Penicillium riverlandense]KAJ5806839.1 hypothetical protein N7474_010431 [Penicillium riverlandense]
MCYRVVERYAACKCLYFEHSIDPCSSFGQRGHSVLEKTVLVGLDPVSGFCWSSENAGSIWNGSAVVGMMRVEREII